MFLLRTTRARREYDRSYRTKVQDAHQLFNTATGETLTEMERICPLTNGSGRPGSDLISVGRALSCDLVIRDPSVSKLQGHFRDVTRNTAYFSDARPSNPTRLDGVRLAPGTGAMVATSSHIVFGRVQCVLVSAGGLHDLFGIKNSGSPPPGQE